MICMRACFCRLCGDDSKSSDVSRKSKPADITTVCHVSCPAPTGSLFL